MALQDRPAGRAHEVEEGDGLHPAEKALIQVGEVCSFAKQKTGRVWGCLQLP